jgi:hypothetical protein
LLPGGPDFALDKSIVVADLDADGIKDIFVGASTEDNFVLWGKRSAPSGPRPTSEFKGSRR